MNEELDKKLVKSFPLLYGDRDAPMQSTAMCWGFPGDGWFDIIWDLSSKLEPLIQKFIADNPNLTCSKCGCKKSKHYGSKTRSPGKCLSIHVDPYSEEEAPGNYRACFCDTYAGKHYRLKLARNADSLENAGVLAGYIPFVKVATKTGIRFEQKDGKQKMEVDDVKWLEVRFNQSRN